MVAHLGDGNQVTCCGFDNNNNKTST